MAALLRGDQLLQQLIRFAEDRRAVQGGRDLLEVVVRVLRQLERAVAVQRVNEDLVRDQVEFGDRLAELGAPVQQAEQLLAVVLEQVTQIERVQAVGLLEQRLLQTHLDRLVQRLHDEREVVLQFVLHAEQMVVFDCRTYFRIDARISCRTIACRLAVAQAVLRCCCGLVVHQTPQPATALAKQVLQMVAFDLHGLVDPAQDLGHIVNRLVALLG